MSATDRIAQLEAQVERLLARVETLEAEVERLRPFEARVAFLEAENAELKAENAALKAENAALKAENAALKEKLAKSSRNSSKPPSSDGPKERHQRVAKKPTGRGPGGQPGHARHERPEVPPEKVSKREVVKPKHCERCTTALSGSDPEPRRHQVFELPKLEPIVTEYELHTLDCNKCGHTTRARLPAGAPTRVFGPSVEAACGYFMGVHRVGKRGMAEILFDVFGLPISVGAVVDCQNEVRRALETPYDEAVAHAQAAPIKNADETSWREGNVKGRANAWLWTLVTSTVIVFMIHRSRAQQAASKLLLNGKVALKDLVVGYLGTDRHGAYNFWPLALRQFCWSHLQRDFTAISERAGRAGVLGTKLVEETARMFAWWHRVRDGTLCRNSFKVYMRPLRARVEALLREGSGLLDKKTARTCTKLLKTREAMWTFVRVEGLEPTNNSSERAVRHGVLFRKVSGGTKSPEGSRFVERILTVHATLRLQRRAILPFLREACAAHRNGARPPSLLPDQLLEIPTTQPRLRAA